MFKGCESLTSLKELENWNTQQVTDMKKCLMKLMKM